MTDWPTRGQKAPDYWDLQTKAYVDEKDATLQTQIDNITASDVESVASIQSDGGGDVPAALLKIALNLPDDTVDELSGLQTQINDIEASDVETVAGVSPAAGDVPVGALKTALDPLLSATYVAAVMPEAYGAVGDGVADDTAEINAAVAAVGPGGTLRLTAGKTYKISAPIAIANKTDMVFDGSRATINMVGTGSIYGAIELSGTCTNVLIRNARIRGTATIIDQQAGVMVHDSASNIITNCGVIDSDIKDVCLGISVNLTTSGGSVSGWLVEGNSLENIVGTASGYGYGIHLSTGQATPTGARIIGNRIKGAQRHGIYHSFGIGSVIVGNTICDHRLGVATGDVRPAIAVQRSTDVAVIGNTVVDCYDGALLVTAESGTLDGVTVSGNTFARCLNGVPLVTVGDSAPTSTTRNVGIFGNVLKTTGTGQLVHVRCGIGVTIGENVMDFNNAVGGSAIQLSGAGDTGTANFNDAVTIAENTITMRGGGTNYLIRLSGIELTTAQVRFRNNVGIGHTATFITGTAATNPNMATSGQRADGLTYSSGIGQAFEAVPSAMFIPNRTATPSFVIGSGAYMWAQSGAIRARTDGGATLTTIMGDVSTKSSNYTATSADSVIFGIGGAGGITITLPASNRGGRYTVKKVDAGAGAVTVATAGGNIDGAATKVLAAQYDKVTVVGDGTNWFIVA